MLCMYTLYFKRCTFYKFIEINFVLFCSVKLALCLLFSYYLYHFSVEAVAVLLFFIEMNRLATYHTVLCAECNKIS